MSLPVVSKMLFTITYPPRRAVRHVPLMKLRALAHKQLPDLDVIDTIDHLFKCPRCFDNYRRIVSARMIPAPPPPGKKSA
ncbi:MAG TPA: hypothetical protein VLU25_03600 [Acidobacteriota bacterium]|nr:hypothetical protein [Acidobacteriota bacterium]